MSRKRKTKIQKIRPVINPYAAAADIGAREIYVAVPVELSESAVRRFETFTEDLRQLVDWLAGLKITTVAMEATSVYWIALAELLEDAGIGVCLVNPRAVQNVSGRKSDVMDCQWLQYLHAVGLLRAAFRPEAKVRAVRTLWRHRSTLVRQSAQQVQHMHKALDQMNLQVHHVLADITGVTGTAIVEAILEGERDPCALARFRDKRVKASPQTLVKALTGDYRPEHLFCLRQAYQALRFIEKQITEADVHIGQKLDELTQTTGPLPATPPAGAPKRSAKHAPGYPAQERLRALFGVDLTSIPGVSTLTAQTVWAELGADLSAFPTVKHFCSWLSLCPDNRTSAGKCLSTKTRASANRLAHALRLAAQCCHHAKHELGDYYRKMRARLGAAEGLVATAHKIARILYAVITTRTPYEPSILARSSQHLHAWRVKKLHSMALHLGFHLVPNQHHI
ncbi:transposase IS116/IS110/IS902 family [Opitutaceae bacterium TAV1]|nr:transposase IS116/IS110/IS902 family [Opitutaceae bacterium TAV1]